MSFVLVFLQPLLGIVIGYPERRRLISERFARLRTGASRPMLGGRNQFPFLAPPPRVALKNAEMIATAEFGT